MAIFMKNPVTASGLPPLTKSQRKRLGRFLSLVMATNEKVEAAGESSTKFEEFVNGETIVVKIGIFCLRRIDNGTFRIDSFSPNELAETSPSPTIEGAIDIGGTPVIAFGAFRIIFRIDDHEKSRKKSIKKSRGRSSTKSVRPRKARSATKTSSKKKTKK